MVSVSVHNMLKDVAASFSMFLFVLSFIAGLHVTSRRPCWWSRTKEFLFSCKFFEEIFFCFDPQHGRLVTWLQTKNTQPTTSFNACYTGHMGPQGCCNNCHFHYRCDVSRTIQFMLLLTKNENGHFSQIFRFSNNGDEDVVANYKL